MGPPYSPPATLSEAGAPPLPPHFLPTAECSVEDLPPRADGSSVRSALVLSGFPVGPVRRYLTLGPPWADR